MSSRAASIAAFGAASRKAPSRNSGIAIATELVAMAGASTGTSASRQTAGTMMRALT
jgi:hypothetical protein